MQEDLGWSTTAATGAFSLALLVSGVAAPFVGRWIDRRGARALMSLGSMVGAALVFAWASVEELFVFYLIWIGIGLAMAATLYEPAFTVLTKWFERGRGRALLMVTLAGGFASTIFLPLSAWLIEVQGWRAALLTLAVILAVLTVLPHAFVLRKEPRDLGLLPDGQDSYKTAEEFENDEPAIGPAASVAGKMSSVPPAVPSREALQGVAFWLLTAAFSLGTLAQVAISVHLIPYLAESGYSLGSAATVTGLVGASQVLGRVVVTVLDGRLSRDLLAPGIFGLQATAVVVLMVWSGTAGLAIFVISFGAASGAMTIVRASSVAEFYGPAHYGSIGGMVAMFVMGAKTIAPVGAGALYVLTGGYESVLWALITASTLAMAAMFLAQRTAPTVAATGSVDTEKRV